VDMQGWQVVSTCVPPVQRMLVLYMLVGQELRNKSPELLFPWKPKVSVCVRGRDCKLCVSKQAMLYLVSTQSASIHHCSTDSSKVVICTETGSLDTRLHQASGGPGVGRTWGTVCEHVPGSPSVHEYVQLGSAWQHLQILDRIFDRP
jgi:hypothetical protein